MKALHDVIPILLVRNTYIDSTKDNKGGDKNTVFFDMVMKISSSTTLQRSNQNDKVSALVVTLQVMIVITDVLIG